MTQREPADWVAVHPDAPFTFVTSKAPEAVERWWHRSAARFYLRHGFTDSGRVMGGENVLAPSLAARG